MCPRQDAPASGPIGQGLRPYNPGYRVRMRRLPYGPSYPCKGRVASWDVTCDRKSLRAASSIGSRNLVDRPTSRVGAKIKHARRRNGGCDGSDHPRETTFATMELYISRLASNALLRMRTICSATRPARGLLCVRSRNIRPPIFKHASVSVSKRDLIAPNTQRRGLKPTMPLERPWDFRLARPHSAFHIDAWTF